MGIRRIAILGLVSAAALASPRALAASCQVANVTPMNFGNYDVATPNPVDSVGELDVTCSSPTQVQIILGRGLSGHQTPREMTGRGASLLYNLFADAARTIIWGDGTEGTQTFFGMVGAGQTLRLPIFGRVFAMQRIPAGRYVDRIVVAVVF